LVAGILGWKRRRSDEWGVEEASSLESIEQTDGYRRRAGIRENAWRKRVKGSGFVNRISYVPESSSVL
jgi:hypothetical protein